MADETKGPESTTDKPDAPASEEMIVEPAPEKEEEAQVEQLCQELAESKNQLLRIAAEFENFKKRMERDKSKLLKYAEENILRDLLLTLDNLDRAVDQGKSGGCDDARQLAAMLEGIELTRKGLISTFERHEVTPLQSVGMPFNPDEHDALTMEPDAQVPANHVIREFAKGYRFKDKVLRHAQVIVSSGPPQDQES